MVMSYLEGAIVIFIIVILLGPTVWPLTSSSSCCLLTHNDSRDSGATNSSFSGSHAVLLKGNQVAKILEEPSQIRWYFYVTDENISQLSSAAFSDLFQTAQLELYKKKYEPVWGP
jgi:hypothetical protein